MSKEPTTHLARVVKLKDLYNLRRIYIKVTKQESSIIQTELFKHGIVWGAKGITVSYLDQEVIGIYEDNSLVYFDDFESMLTQDNIAELEYIEVIVDFEPSPLTLLYIDTCLPDYFGGHHLPIVQVPVNSTTTYQQLQDILLCTYMCIDHLDDVDEEEYVPAVYKYFETEVNDLNSIPAIFSNIEDVPEEDQDPVEGCYAYFVLIEGEEV